MNANRILQIMNERDEFKQERDRYRAECYALRALSFLLTVSCIVVIATNSWVALLVAALCMLCGLFLASLCWAAHRGDEHMGIGDSQGRETSSTIHYTPTPWSNSRSGGHADPLR